MAELADNEAEPVGKYEKICTETPIIAYELQKAFGITADSEEKIESPAEKPLRARDIFRNTKETSSTTKPVAANTNSSEKKQSILDKILQHKIIFVILVALAGLTVMVASYHRPTPTTVDQFIKQYNEEIKRTAGAVENHGRGGLVKSCTFDNDLVCWK